MRGWPFGDLPAWHFGVIAADPPWHFETRTPEGEGRSPQAQYDTMELDEICALPVADLAKRDSVLLLWFSSPLLEHAQTVMRAWGFRYGAMAHWGKQTRDGKRFKRGTGYVVGSTAESIMIGLRGRPALPGNSCPNLIAGDGDLLCAPRREHSRKPDGFHEWAEDYWRGPYLELFARRSDLHPLWSFWGNQADKFNRRDA
ncbi:MT-A70 family methyltransferase [Hyphobacterium sp.]|uniref:MT-A70 family methyltransferase n=1 Tax=Hyphobacterium sp. TaxID=2004662 RepID=UPI003BAC951B